MAVRQDDMNMSYAEIGNDIIQQDETQERLQTMFKYAQSADPASVYAKAYALLSDCDGDGDSNCVMDTERLGLDGPNYVTLDDGNGIARTYYEDGTVEEHNYMEDVPIE